MNLMTHKESKGQKGRYVKNHILREAGDDCWYLVFKRKRLSSFAFDIVFPLTPANKMSKSMLSTSTPNIITISDILQLIFEFSPY